MQNKTARLFLIPQKVYILRPKFTTRLFFSILVAMRNIAIVTGASSGMGVHFAKGLAEEKAAGLLELDELWIIARRKDRLENLAHEITGVNVRSVELDLDGSRGALAFRSILEKEAGEQEDELVIKVLVNNAGFGTYGEFSATDTAREMQMIDVDCTALTGLTGFSLPYMRKGSRIINVASLASFMPLGNFAVYGACKAYVLSFSVALAAELRHKGIWVTALCPGPVSTEFAEVASRGARKEVRHGLSAKKTADRCLKDSRRGKLYSMYALKWRLKACATRLIGRYAGAWFTYRFCKRPSN